MKKTIIVIVIILIGGYLYHRHTVRSLKQDTRDLIDAYRNKEIDNARLNVLVTKYGDSLLYARQTILDRDKAIQLGIIERKKLKDMYLKKVNTIVELKEEISIIKKQGKIVDPIFIRVHDTVYMPVGTQLLFSDPWYNLSVKASDPPVLDSLSVYSAPTLTIGQIRKGLLKRAQTVTIYKNDCPYVKVRDIESITIKNNEKWYQTTWAKIGAGFLGGIAFSSWVK